MTFQTKPRVSRVTICSDTSFICIQIKRTKVKNDVIFTRGNFTSFLTFVRSEEHTSELQSRVDLVCRLLLEKKNNDVVVKTNKGVPIVGQLVQDELLDDVFGSPEPVRVHVPREHRLHSVQHDDARGSVHDRT